jgi:hypothetical protein
MTMTLEETKVAVRGLTIDERRKIALYILELEKDHLQGTIGPQLREDLEGFARVVQDTVERIKNHIDENFRRPR